MSPIGCNCGGKRPAQPGALTGVAGQPPAPANTQYEVTYPNGAVVVFNHEWQAHQALALSGGSLRTLEPANTAG